MSKVPPIQTVTFTFTEPPVMISVSHNLGLDQHSDFLLPVIRIGRRGPSSVNLFEKSKPPYCVPILPTFPRWDIESNCSGYPAGIIRLPTTFSFYSYHFNTISKIRKGNTLYILYASKQYNNNTAYFILYTSFIMHY